MWETIVTVFMWIVYGVGAVASLFCCYCLYFIAVGFREQMKREREKNCDHMNQMYDDGHPDFPWKCNGCGKRF